MRKLFFLLIMLIAIISCSRNNKNNIILSSELIPLNVPVDEKEFIIPNQLKNTRFLALESKENNKISSANKVIFFGQKIFIFDEQQNKIFIFKDNGHFSTQIDNKGNGPNEYLYLSDFLINKDDSCLELLDAGNRKILQFDNKYAVKKEIKIPFFCQKFTKTEQNGYIFFTNNQHNANGKNEKSYNLILTNQNAQEINSFLPIEPEKQDLIIAEPYTFTPYHNGIVFSLPIDNTIYHIADDTISCSYNISFGKYNTPDNILSPLQKSNSQNRIQLQMQIFNNIVKNGYAYSIHSVLENRTYLFFQFRKGKNSYSVLYNKKKKQIITGKNYSNNIKSTILGQPVAINDDNELITILFPYELLNSSNRNKSKKGNIEKTKSGELKNQLGSISQFDNPIFKFIKLSN